jgi:hypothetical protein
VKQVRVNEEFYKLQGLVNIDFDFAATEDHEPIFERFIRTVKDYGRSQYNILPFRYVLKVVVRHLVLNSVFCWNGFPHCSGPFGHNIFNGVHIDFERHVRIPFGAYSQTHEPHDNPMAASTSPSIALGPTGNQRGSQSFMSLRTGRVRRSRWNNLPMPQDVVYRVSVIGHQQGMPQTLTFADAYGWEMYDAEHDIDDDHDDGFEYVPVDDVSLV